MSNSATDQLDAGHKAADLRIKNAQADLLDQQLKEAQAKLEEAKLPFWRKPGAVNTSLTILAALVTAFSGIMTSIITSHAEKSAHDANAKLEEAKQQIDVSRLKMEEAKGEIENAGLVIANQTSTQEGSYRYVKEIMDRMQRMESLYEKMQRGEKSLEMRTILPSLKIITEASTSKTHQSVAETREFILVKLALLMGQHHEAAGLDPTLGSRKEWIRFAATDTDATRATAIMALAIVGRSAISRGETKLLDDATSAIVEIEELMYPDSTDNLGERLSITTEKARLHHYWNAKKRPGGDSHQVAKWGKNEDLLLVNSAMEERLTHDKSTNNTIQTEKDIVIMEEARKILDSTKKIIPNDKVDSFYQEYLNDLMGTDEQRRSATYNLAVQGSLFVSRLSLTLNKSGTSIDHKKRIIGVFRKMPQPLLMDKESASGMVDQLSGEDEEIRIGAADFLMGCWHPATVTLIYEDLVKRIDVILKTKNASAEPVPEVGKVGVVRPDDVAIKNGLLVHHGGLIIGTWARTLRDSIRTPGAAQSSGGAMNSVALAKAKEWRDALKGNNVPSKGKWNATARLFDELIILADTRRAVLEHEKQLAAKALDSPEKPTAPVNANPR